MNPIEQIEQQFNINYPTIYKKLSDDGMLDWGKSGPDWHATYYEKMKQNPPLLFGANDFELLDFDRILKETEAFKTPDDYRKTKPEFQFIPFAQTAGGDLYVFQFDQKTGEDVPVTLVYHDEETAMILARNFQDFIFRMLLEAVVSIDEYSTIAEGDFELNRSNLLRTHKPYLSQKQFEILSDIYGRELFEYTYTVPNGREFSAKGLLSSNALKDLLQQEIGFDKLDYEFEYMG